MTSKSVFGLMGRESGSYAAGTSARLRAVAGVFATVGLVACGGADGAESSESFGEVESEIRDGTPVSTASSYWKTTVSVGGCTGTIIGPRHILTAAHCDVRTDATVRFYFGDTRTGTTRRVASVYQPWGVDADQWLDVDGKFADYSVLYLSSALPTDYAYYPAKVAVSWPGNNFAVHQVGTGRHDDQPNPDRLMEFRRTNTYAASDAEGHVLVEAQANPGDSGGPLYNADGFPKQVYGVHHGSVWEWAGRAKLTSTAFHLWDILKAAGNVTTNHWDYPGNDLVSAANVSVNECASRCMADKTCKAYTLVGLTNIIPVGTCFLKSGVGAGGRAAAGMWSGRKQTTGACGKSSSTDPFCRL